MNSVSASTDEPWRDLVGMIAFVPWLIEGQGVNFLVCLIERVKLFAESIEVLVIVRSSGNCGFSRTYIGPVYYFVTHHTFVRKCKLRRDVRGFQGLNQFE